MLSSKLLVVGFLYIFYAAGLVTAYPRNRPGDDKQLSKNARTVPVTLATRQSGKNNKDGNKDGKNKNKNANDKANGGDPAKKSLTLDLSVIQKVDGKGKKAGEADSLVSKNNFINFCLGKAVTNGKQVKEGSCNPTPMGDIPAVDKTPSSKFNSPKNFDTIAANTKFTISLQIKNLATGTFTNAANTYYAAPQQLANKIIQGHSHVTVQKMESLDSPKPLNPEVFAFFKGLNDVAKNGVLTADVTDGLAAGVYRIACINSAGNHQEVLGPVAQRGTFNDAIYITVTNDGKGANDDGKGGENSDPKNQDPNKNQDPKNANPKNQDPKNAKPGNQDPNKNQDPKNANPGNQDPKNSNPKNQDPKNANPKNQNPKNANPKNQNPKNQDPKNQDPKNANPKNQSPKNANPKNQNPKNQDPKNPAVLPAKGADGKGGKSPKDGQYTKRMHKRSRSA